MKDDDADLERRIAIAHSRIREAEAVKRQRERDIASGKLISRKEFEARCVGDLAQINRQMDFFVAELAKTLAAKHGLDVSDVAASLRADCRAFQFEASERALRAIREVK
jgi:hypothetical protein